MKNLKRRPREAEPAAAPKARFKRGYDIAKKKFEQQRQRNANRFKPTFRLKPGETRKIVFLTDEPVTVEQYTLRFGPAEYVTVTSPLSLDEDANDPLSRVGAPRSTVSYYTIIDLSSYTDKNGKVHKNQKRLLGAKTQAYASIVSRRKRLMTRGKTLRGAVIQVTRSEDAKSSNVGTDFELLGVWSDAKMLAKLQEADPKATLHELDMDTLLAPPPLKELKELAKRFAGGKQGSDDDEEEFERPRNRRRPAEPDDDDEDPYADHGIDDTALDD